ncbi:MAG TPA: S46 family peptidase, partial [Acidobacteriota bacterium]|nr:S46 family peptidase [Acidobacteriota bacterium]
NGFFAATLADERKAPRTFADQLQLMEDVTTEVVQAFETGKTDEERVANRTAKITEIEKRYKDKTGLNCNVVTFYNGGKYSVYGYKRFTDVRLVFAPELATAFFGGDYDNFTYPRYDLDISFFRVYGDDGKPLKTRNFFKWSKNGAQEGEPVFVIGNPGSTSRLLTVARLEFNRDYAYPYVLARLTEMVSIYSAYIAKHPDSKLQYQTQLFGFSNSQKVYVGRVKGLHDPIIMAKKKDFERKFKNSVWANPSLKSQYEKVWGEIESVQKEKAALFNELQALTFAGIGRPSVLSLANTIVDYAALLRLPEADRTARTRGMTLDAYKERVGSAAINVELDQAILVSHLKFLSTFFGTGNATFNKLTGGMSPEAAAASLMNATMLTKPENVKDLLNKSADEIEKFADPFISFVMAFAQRGKAVREKYSEATSKEQARVQILGKAVFDVYGTSIPPDATFTLRIADGVVKNYEYNGTLAPLYTTFYGFYDRYYSFEKKDHWGIPDRWKNPPATFDMSTRYNFISTNDIIGGNSGSAVVNKNLEVVGIAFDGNIESLPGDFIFDDTQNRCVSVHSSGILEALDDIYKAERLASELRAGKIQ